MKILRAFLGLVLGLTIPGLSTLSTLPAQDLPVPSYRVFRGFKLAHVDAGSLPAEMASRFIPEAPRVMNRHSLISYVPALPPSEKPAGIPDEIAIVVYASGAAYDAGREDPERQAYGRLHWDYFEDPRAGGRTLSQTARPLARALQPEVPVDVMGLWPDWQNGLTHVFVGTRKAAVEPGTFLSRLTDHLVEVRDTFGPLGLDGYIVVANETSEIAWLHWTSREAAEAAFASPAGQQVTRGGQAILDPVMWVEAKPFEGTIAYGEATTVRFKPMWSRSGPVAPPADR